MQLYEYARQVSQDNTRAKVNHMKVGLRVATIAFFEFNNNLSMATAVVMNIT